MLFHVLDPAELDFPFQQVTLFKGLEQFPDVLAEPRALRKAYLQEFNAFLHEVKQGCRAQRIDYVEMRTDQPLDVALSSYLASANDKDEIETGTCSGLMLSLPHRTSLPWLLNHPWMLGWLAAAAAPLIIHLLSKRKYREVPWAAMQYLLAALRKNSRRIQIEQWILLAVRTLADRPAGAGRGRAVPRTGRREARLGRAHAQSAGPRRLLFDGL